MYVYPLGKIIKIKALCELTFNNLLCQCNSNRKRDMKGFSCTVLLCVEFSVGGEEGKPHRNCFCWFAFSSHLNWIFDFGTICRTRNLRYFGQLRNHKYESNLLLFRSISTRMFWRKDSFWLTNKWSVIIPSKYLYFIEHIRLYRIRVFGAICPSVNLNKIITDHSMQYVHLNELKLVYFIHLCTVYTRIKISIYVYDVTRLNVTYSSISSVFPGVSSRPTCLTEIPREEYRGIWHECHHHLSWLLSMWRSRALLSAPPGLESSSPYLWGSALPPCQGKLFQPPVSNIVFFWS